MSKETPVLADAVRAIRALLSLPGRSDAEAKQFMDALSETDPYSPPSTTSPGALRIDFAGLKLGIQSRSWYQFK